MQLLLNKIPRGFRIVFSLCSWEHLPTVMVAGLRSSFSLPSVYAFSPVDSTIVDKETGLTAISILSVFGILFLAGFVGHCCVLAFVSCHKR